MSRKRAAIAVVGLLLAVGACGSDEGSTDEVEQTPTSIDSAPNESPDVSQAPG